MTNVTLVDPLIALEAGEWCNKHFGEKGWNLLTQDLLSGYPKYKFTFPNEQDLTMFSLRWAEHS